MSADHKAPHFVVFSTPSTDPRLEPLYRNLKAIDNFRVKTEFKQILNK